jgi:hypothetical protein
MVSRKRLAAAVLSAICLACGDGGGEIAFRTTPRETGELALPPSASAPRVMRDDQPPDTLVPDSIEEFPILGSDSLLLGSNLPAGLAPDLGVEAITVSYRGHYAAALESEGSAVEGRIDRELQHEAELRTARDRGFHDWAELIGALSPEERARLVDRLNEANVEMARDLHGTAEPREPAEPPSG